MFDLIALLMSAMWCWTGALMRLLPKYDNVVLNLFLVSTAVAIALGAARLQTSGFNEVIGFSFALFILGFWMGNATDD
jgi:hypothetical protein